MLLSQGVNPRTAEVAATLAVGTGHVIEPVALDAHGATSWPDGTGGAGAVVVQYPNYLGVIEDLPAARAAADAAGALLVVIMDPVAMGLLVPPGRYGADVVVGEGQVFGTPLSFGGPYVGLFACRQEHVRRLPGTARRRDRRRAGHHELRDDAADP